MRVTSGSLGVTSINEYPAEAELPYHAHEVPTISIMMRGWQIERIGAKQQRRDPLSVVYKDGGLEHDNRIGTHASRALLVELHPGAPTEVRTALGGRPIAQTRDPGLRLAAAGLCRAALLEPGDVEEAILAILAQLTRRSAERKVPSWLEACRDQVLDQYVDPPTLSELAEEHGVHGVHIAYAFRRHFGCTVGDLRRRRRVACSLYLMTTTDASLAEIGAAVGFADQSHMNRAFRATVGAPPGRLRRVLCGS